MRKCEFIFVRAQRAYEALYRQLAKKTPASVAYKKYVVEPGFDGLVKSPQIDGFVKSSYARRAILEE